MPLRDHAPAVIVFIGAVLSAAGAIWASIDQASAEHELRLKSDKIAALNEQIAGTVTGGDSFGYFIPGNRADGQALLTFVHHGRFPLYEVSANISDITATHVPFANVGTGRSLFSNHENNIAIGNLGPNLARPIGWVSLPAVDSLSYNAFFSARNGTWTQILRMKRVGGIWKSATRVTQTGDSRVVRFEQIDPDYPRAADGTVAW